MLSYSSRLLATATLVAGTLVGFTGVAQAVAGPDTFTKITTPSGPTTVIFNGGAHVTVSGSSSNDVTTVDIVCMINTPSGPSVEKTLASGVTVTGGSFSAGADLGSLLVQCRLRAIPAGVDPSIDYIGSYPGPIMYMAGIDYTKVGSTRIGFEALGSQDDGYAANLDAGQCGPALSGTVALPGADLRGDSDEACAFALTSSNLASTASAITVNGHSAYLPFAVHDFLNAFPQTLGLLQPALTVSFVRFGNGDVRVTESAPLKRCSVSDTYPPTSGSCPGLVNTGVTFTRVSDILRGAHQIRVRDRFSSTDSHAHTVTAQYQGLPTAPSTGAVGYTFPGGSATFHKSSKNEVVTGLASKAASVFVRSDIFAFEGDPSADTLGLTWSRAPQKIQFSGSVANFWAMPYSLSVPANGRANLGFAYSVQVATSDTKKLAGVAVAEMVMVPTIGSPKNGAIIKGHSTTVKGAVTLGANGLPTSVVVNGHAAHLTKVTATKATYSATFNETFGTHTINVTAKDSAGNTKSKSITIKNVSP
jgi:hypothetical protein